MNNKKIWALRNIREKITGFIPTSYLYFVLRSQNGILDYALIKLIYQYTSELRYNHSLFEDVQTKKTVNLIVDSCYQQTLFYEDPIQFNNSYKTSYLIPINEVLDKLNIPNHGFVYRSQLDSIIEKYNATMQIKPLEKK